jgi:mono/diheme cytochrome c family protein
MKKSNYLLAGLFLGTSLVFFACSSGTENKAKQPETAVQEETAAVASTAAADEMATMMARGEQIYKEKCIACHQANGQGLAGAFPTLVGSDFLLNQKALAVSQVLNGSEKVSANKAIKYPAPMPPQVDTKEDAVAVNNYILNNFGNNGGSVSLEDVKDIEIMAR